MIYLISGPPKCGKTTLAKKISQEKGIPWVSTDTLQNVIKPYIREQEWEEKFPSTQQQAETNDEKYSTYSAQEIIVAYRGQANTCFAAIEMFALCEMTDGNDVIIEGYHIEPELIQKLTKAYPEKIRSIVLVKTDVEQIVENIQKSTTPNDWILTKTTQPETYQKIANMIANYSDVFISEAKKHDCQVVHMDTNFEEKLQQAVDLLYA